MNELKHIADFRAALERYELSTEAHKTLAQTKLVLLTAATASGRNTIINELVKTGDYHYIVSDTTRQPRSNNGVMEQNGVEYWFRREDDVLADIQTGNFLEAEIIHGQQVSGISMRELQKASDEHKIAITDVDIGGISVIARNKPDTVAILVLPPSFEEWQRRITSRGDMPADEYRRRLETAERIFATALQADYLKPIINDKLDDAVATVNVLATTGMYDTQKEAAARQLLGDLYQKTHAYLQQTSS